MKYLIVTTLVLTVTAGAATAQTTGSNRNNSTTHSGEGTPKKQKKQKPALNHRKNYNWKSGQQATPTGQEATGNGSGYQSGRKDTAGKRDQD